MNTLHKEQDRHNNGAQSAFFSQRLSDDGKGLSDGMRGHLEAFLRTVANSALKVRVLEFFLAQPGVCVGTGQLAERLRVDHQEVRDAVQELGWQGALTFCPYFGRGDLCLMNPQYQTEQMKRDLNILMLALRHAPGEVETHLASLEKAE